MALLVTECQELHKKGPFFTRPLLSLTFLSSPNYANKGSISVVKGRIEADRKANEKVAIKGKEEKRTTKVSFDGLLSYQRPPPELSKEEE